MEKSRVTADRVRPILQAMERSIDSARRRRLHGSQPQSPAPSHTPTTYQPQHQPQHQQPVQRDYGQPAQPPAPSIPQEGALHESDLHDESVPRRKARPTRPSPMKQSYDDPDYRAQAS